MKQFACTFVLFVTLFCSAAAFAGPADDAAEHKSVVVERLMNYFKFEYPVGSNSIKVTDSAISVEETLPVQGWADRFRSKGRANVEYFDSATRSFNRFSRQFEVVTERNQEGVIKIESLQVR